jgi:hypothetical protein
MSIKNLFGKTVPSYEDVASDVESSDFIDQVVAKRETYLPPIDFSDPENFVFYGSAQLYYEAAIKRIYEDYPYDGSKAEQIEFEEKSSYLERWIFDHKYPKSTGHIQLGTTQDFTTLSGLYMGTNTHEYIRIWGGLHTGSASDSLGYQLSNSAKYDESKNRTQNFNCDFEEGVTLEFWMKKETPTPFQAEVILDLWNGAAATNESRMIVEFIDFGTPNIRFNLKKGSDFEQKLVDISSHFNTQVWTHFAFSLVEQNSTLDLKIYINGHPISDPLSFSKTYEFEGKMNAFIGSLQTSISGFGSIGSGKFQGYLDEFRFWKTKRTDRQIKLNWFREIGGGANTDDSRSDLGVYLKFNEGITGIDSIDKNVLDYSGRLANGYWEGYPGSSARSTQSAMESAGFTEKPSPIIYPSHPEVSALETEMSLSGSSYDGARGQAFYKSLPNWLVEEDQEEGQQNLRKVSHILASYMDTLRVQIDSLSSLQNKQYLSSSYKASPFASELLKNKGFTTSEMFLSSEVIETFSSIDYDEGQYDLNVDEIKNLIFTNIYNNLENIYNSKGTEKSIRNLIRCFGIDDELIKLNQYTDFGTQYLGDKYRTTSVKKKYINTNGESLFNGTIYQSGSKTFISGDANASTSAFTMEADILVPFKAKVGEEGFYATPFLSASVMGFHEANPNDEADFTWHTSGTEARDLQVYLVRDEKYSRNAKFVVKNESETIYEESDVILDIYEDEHYNVALRIKPQTYPYAGNVTNTQPDYDIELYAVSHNFDEIKEEVLVTTSVSYDTGSAYLTTPKRLYAAAHCQDFTGPVLQQSDLEFGRVSAWLDYVNNDAIKEHNKDILNYGNSKSIDGASAFAVDGTPVPTMELSILNWDFDTVSQSDSSGEFDIDDTTSGSSDIIYGWIDEVIRREHKGVGANFPTESTAFLANEFLYSNKKQLPETSFNANNIFIKGEEEINFGEDDDVSDNLFILEKSPSSIVSEEMLNLFSTTQEFSNLFGRHIDRYRIEYKDLAKARQLFYERANSGMDFDKFFTYFKWIDQSLSEMINQLIPASVNYAGGVVDVIEPHILERDKYQRQVGLLQTVTSTEASIRGVQELNYNWRIGHAPIPLDDTTNSLWQKERSERDLPEQQTISEVLTTQVQTGSFERSFLSGTNGTYEGRAYASRRFSRSFRTRVEFADSIHGGTNYTKNKDRDLLRSGIGLHSELGGSGAPKNVVTIGAGDGYGLNVAEVAKNQDARDPREKIKYDGFAIVGKFTDFSNSDYAPLSPEFDYYSRRKVANIFIGNIVSSSVTSGYHSLINDNTGDGFRDGVNVVNLHSDTTDISNEIPIQGPFTERWVGGHQHRHVDLNSVGKPERLAQTGFNGLDHRFSRPEGWRFLIGKNPLSSTDPNSPDVDVDGAIGFTPPDYGIGSDGRFPDEDRLYAIYYREERAKRPVNVKNIQTTTSSVYHGNYQHEYEVLSTFGDQGYFLRRAGDLLPDEISSELPETTNYMTLAGQNAYPFGNGFLSSSNRFSDGDRLIFSEEVAGQYASGGSFKVLGKDWVSDDDDLQISGTTFSINTGAGVVVSTGSSDANFYSNIETAIESNIANVNASFTSHPEVLSNAIAISGIDSNVGFHNSSISYGEDIDFSISLYLNIMDTSTNNRYIYSEPSLDGNGYARELYISSAGHLFYERNFVSSSTNVQDILVYENFLSEYSGTLTHIVVSNDLKIGTSSEYSLYINGEETTWTNENLSPNPLTELANTPSEAYFLCRTTGSSATTGLGSNSLKVYVDEIVIFRKFFSGAGAVDEVYNSGVVWDTSSLTSINYSTEVFSYYSCDNASDDFRNGGQLTDEKGANNLICADVDLSDLLRLEAQGAIETIASASFTISPTLTGSYANFSIEATPSETSFFQASDSIGGVDYEPEISTLGLDNVIETQDRSTGSNHVIRTRFSAPGGPEVNSSGYLDVATQQYSVHNSINFRNLTVRSSGSGEDNTMRVVSHANRQEGLRTLRTRYQGQFGIDSQHGAVSSADYDAEASWHKQHRNTRKVAKIGDFNNDGIETEEVINRYDNDHYHTPLPASDFQYSWINSAISGSNWEDDQIILTHAPRNGLISSSAGITEAIIFPSASSFYGE